MAPSHTTWVSLETLTVHAKRNDPAPSVHLMWEGWVMPCWKPYRARTMREIPSQYRPHPTRRGSRAHLHISVSLGSCRTEPSPPAHAPWASSSLLEHAQEHGLSRGSLLPRPTEHDESTGLGLSRNIPPGRGSRSRAHVSVLERVRTRVSIPPSTHLSQLQHGAQHASHVGGETCRLNLRQAMRRISFPLRVP